MLYDHSLGANNVNNMASEAEFTLANGHYQGEKKHWLFEKHVRQQVDQHLILKGLKYHGHCGIDPGSEVQYLLAAIKTSTLNPAKTQILANADLGTDFHRCVNLLKDFIKQSTTSQVALDANISKLSNISLSGADHDDNETDGGGSAVIEDRYYSKAEYGKMSQGDKKLLWDRRQKRGGQDGQEKECPLKRSKTVTVASLNRKIAALEKRMQVRTRMRVPTTMNWLTRMNPLAVVVTVPSVRSLVNKRRKERHAV